MAAPPSPPVTLQKLDPYSEDKKEDIRLSPLWLANLVDTYNTAMTQIEAQLNSIEARLTAGGL